MVKAEALAIDSIGEFLFSYGYKSGFGQEDSMYANFYKIIFRVENKEVEVFLFSEKDKNGFMNFLKSKPITFIKLPCDRRSFYIIENWFTLEYEFEKGNGMIDWNEKSYMVVYD